MLGQLQKAIAGQYTPRADIDDKALDDAELAPIAAKALTTTLLMFDAKYDVEEKAYKPQK